ncbi:MAG: DUF349 domain-containing protein [Flavobacteriaceae bacterium]|jgi:hypothetical protein|nr:DUF349 domain-containing protein [Flavobacteriaceae bacterium]
MLENKNDNLQVQAEGQESTLKSVETAYSDKEKALDSIANFNAEDNEDNASQEESSIPQLDYDLLDFEQLNAQLSKLVKNHKVTAIRNHVNEIRKVFYGKYNDLINEKKTVFFEENPDALDTEFEFIFPIKGQFDSLYHEFRVLQDNHFKTLQNSLNNNLEKRLAIIDKLKNLVDEKEGISDALKQLADIREEWKNAGAIPKDKYNHVWNNYHFHLERFYDQLHLDREARDLDFKYNLEQKTKLIARAELLLQEEDVMKAFGELQTLHRIWREEIGPVDREVREQVWERFSDLTKQLHDKRELLFDQLRQVEKEHLALKVNIISEIDKISKQQITNHSIWQKEIKRVEELRQRFFSIGRIPIEYTDEVWGLFQLANRNFNQNKNNFYKELKREQQENYAKKLALLEKAQAHKDSDDYEKATPIMKKIQDDWKKIGHVPRKYSEQLWADFKEACNSFFDRYHEQRKLVNKEGLEVYDKKKAYLDMVKGITLSGDHKQDLEEIKKHIAAWKELGKVPFEKRFIEGKFNKALDVLFDQLSLSKREMEAEKFNSRIDNLMEENDGRKLQQEVQFVQRKIEEISSDVIQLENNLAYISNATKDNPLVKEVNKSIDRSKEELKIWKDKLTKLRNLNA